MKNAGITLILAGVALIGAIGLDATKSTTYSTPVLRAAIANRKVAPIRLFSTVSTVLIVLGIGATAFGKNEK